MKCSNGISCCVIILICSIFAVPVFGQPDAGTILREHSLADMPLPEGEAPYPKKKPAGTPALDPETTVMVKGFRFKDYQGLVGEDELKALIKGSVNKEMGLSGLRNLLSVITGYLRDEKGYLLARAYLPEQDITDGIIDIGIISGSGDGSVRIDREGASRIDPSLLEAIANRAVPQDSPIRLKHLERATLLVKDLPGIDCETTIEPGETKGTSRVKIIVTEGPLLKGVISGDNYGDRYTGTYRGTGRFFLMDPLGWGDRIDFSLTEGDHLTLWNAGYSITLGSSGLRMNSTYRGLSYEVGKELAALKAEGSAYSFSSNIRYPVIRSGRANLWAGMGIERLTLKDEADNAGTSDRKLLKCTAFVSGNLFDEYFGKGLSSASIALTRGDADLSGLAANEAADNARAKTSGGFIKGTYRLARLQRVTDLISLYGSLRGQFASGNLDSSQKFILGGPKGVRAYPIGEAPGDEGRIFTLEARIDLPFIPDTLSTQLTGFFDAGRIRLHKDTWSGSVTNIYNRNSYSLKGAGIGINVSPEDIYELNASYAHEIGSNDGTSTHGNDADNLDNDGRFWLDMTILF